MAALVLCGTAAPEFAAVVVFLVVVVSADVCPGGLVLNKKRRVGDAGRDALAHIALDGRQAVDILLRAEGIGLARLARARGTSDAVHVVLRLVGDVVIDDHRKVVHIDTAGGDIRRDEALNLAGLEVVHNLLADFLRQVADKELALHAVEHEALGDDLAAALRVAEDYQAFRRIPADNAEQQLHLLVAGHVQEHLVNLVHRDMLRVDGDFRRIARVLPRKVLHVGIERGAEQHGLPLLRGRQEFEQRAQVGVEAHVEHTVCLVYDKEHDVVQLHLVTLVQVNHTTRRADKDVYPPLEGGNLLVIPDTTEKTRASEGRMLHELLRLLLHLHRELAGRNHNQGLFPGNLRPRQKLLHDGNKVCGRLAGTCLRLDVQIASFQGILQNLFLNRSTVNIAGTFDSLQQIFM